MGPWYKLTNPKISSQEVEKSTRASPRPGRTPNDTVNAADAELTRNNGKQTRKKRRHVRVRAAIRKATRTETSRMVTTVRVVCLGTWLTAVASTGAALSAASATPL